MHPHTCLQLRLTLFLPPLVQPVDRAVPQMSAVAKASWLLEEHSAEVQAHLRERSVQEEQGPPPPSAASYTATATAPTSESKLLQLCVLQQYLKWAHVADGCLFQGWGGFTRDFLQGHGGNAVHQALPQGTKAMYTADPLFGDFWPTVQFSCFAERYFGGDTNYGGFGRSQIPLSNQESAREH